MPLCSALMLEVVLDPMKLCCGVMDVPALSTVTFVVKSISLSPPVDTVAFSIWVMRPELEGFDKSTELVAS